MDDNNQDNYNRDEQNNSGNNLDDFYNNTSNSVEDNNNNNYYNNNNSNRDPYSYATKREGVPKWVIAVVSIILSIALLVAGGFGGYFIGIANRYTDEDMQLANTLYEMIEEFYYEDISRVDFDKAAALGVASMLDDFSGLMLSDSEPSPLFGLSIISDSTNHHYIIEVEPKSNAGLAQGTLVTSKGEAIAGAPSAQKYNMMRGDELHMLNGIKVVGLDRDYLQDESLLGDDDGVFVIKRIVEGETLYIRFSIEKSFYDTTDAMYTSMGNGVGVIDLNTFGGADASDFEFAANEFRKDDTANKLILDLRDNGGGSVSIQSTIATYLIDHSKFDNKSIPINRIVYKDKSVSIFTTDDLTKDNYFVGRDKDAYELVVLVNGSSASASEGLVGVLRAYMPETIIIGEATYGKGVAQMSMPVPVPQCNLTLHLTVGYYDVPVFADDVLVWTNYHERPHQPNKGYLIPSIDPYNPAGTMTNYYNNDITQELAYIAAMEAFGL